MWFVNAHVVDVLTGDVLRQRAVETAADGTVAQVTASAPAGPAGRARSIDVAGRWLLPGLISCHTHLSVVFPFCDTDEAENPAHHRLPVRHQGHDGTAGRDHHDPLRARAEPRRPAAARRRSGAAGSAAPRILGAGRAISDRGGHGQGAGLRVRQRGGQEFHAAALAELAAGADHVKIFINGGLASAGEQLRAARR